MIYYSVRTRKALKERLSRLPLGLPHYSYGIVCKKFLSMFEETGIQVAELPMPEIYPSYRDLRRPTGDQSRPIHLMFKAFDEFRLLKGAYNIAHVAWEYGSLPSFETMPQLHPKRAYPLNDYIAALKLVNEIWVGCSFTKDTLTRAGLSNVHVIPAPIDMPEESARAAGEEESPFHDSFMHGPLQIIDATRSSIMRGQVEDPAPTPGEGLFMRIADRKLRGGKVFLSIFNPHDPRKNPGPMLAGFQRYCQKRRPSDLLILKILVDGKYNTLDDVLRVILPRRCRESLGSFDLVDCENIVLVCGVMSEPEMDRLYDAVDFYLCTSSAEGQNLPLLEAMARGVVPIAPATTAMADYISEDNSVVVPATEVPVYDSAASAYGLAGARWQEVSAQEVALAVERAAALDRGTFAKRAAAVQMVAERYAPVAVARLVRQRLDAIQKELRFGAKSRTNAAVMAAAQ